MDEQELYYQAVATYFRWCKRHNFIPQQPSWGLSEVYHVAGSNDMLVDLANVNGPLVSCRFDGKKNRLKRLDRVNS
jgi:hypothetical protein